MEIQWSFNFTFFSSDYSSQNSRVRLRTQKAFNWQGFFCLLQVNVFSSSDFLLVQALRTDPKTFTEQKKQYWRSPLWSKDSFYLHSKDAINFTPNQQYHCMLGLPSERTRSKIKLICLTYERFRISGKILGTNRTTGTWLLNGMHWLVVRFTCVPSGVPCSSHRTQASPSSSSSPSPSSSMVVTSVHDIHHKSFLLFLLLCSFRPLLFQGLENTFINSILTFPMKR